MSCDSLYIGVLVQYDQDYLLLRGSRGFAPPTTHYEGRPDIRAAAVGHIKTLLDCVVDLGKPLLLGVPLYSLCDVHGYTCHNWWVFTLQLTSDQANRFLNQLCTTKRLGALMKRTDEFLHKRISPVAWQRKPGLDPNWIDIIRLIRYAAKQ